MQLELGQSQDSTASLDRAVAVVTAASAEALKVVAVHDEQRL